MISSQINPRAIVGSLARVGSGHYVRPQWKGKATLTVVVVLDVSAGESLSSLPN